MPNILNLFDPFAKKRLNKWFLRNKIKTQLTLHSSIVKNISIVKVGWRALWDMYTSSSKQSNIQIYLAHQYKQL